MRKTLLLLLITASITCCRKKDETVNNYTTVGSSQPSFAINGINDITFVNDITYENTLSLTVQYLDSAQENVTLSLSGLPSGINIDTTWINSGIPTFSTTLTVFDTSANGTTPGIYPLTLTATTVSGKVKTYPFNLKIQGMPTVFLGRYNNCTSGCSGGTYTDSIYADASVPNKVWFNNFANTGNKIYALIGVSESITIPSQTIGGTTYFTTGSSNIVNLESHTISIFAHTSTSSGCYINMN
jgi:hypothetical protein